MAPPGGEPPEAMRAEVLRLRSAAAQRAAAAEEEGARVASEEEAEGGRMEWMLGPERDLSDGGSASEPTGEAETAPRFDPADALRREYDDDSASSGAGARARGRAGRAGGGGGARESGVAGSKRGRDGAVQARGGGAGAREAAGAAQGGGWGADVIDRVLAGDENGGVGPLEPFDDALAESGLLSGSSEVASAAEPPGHRSGRRCARCGEWPRKCQCAAGAAPGRAGASVGGLRSASGAGAGAESTSSGVRRLRALPQPACRQSTCPETARLRRQLLARVPWGVPCPEVTPRQRAAGD